MRAFIKNIGVDNKIKLYNIGTGVLLAFSVVLLYNLIKKDEVKPVVRSEITGLQCQIINPSYQLKIQGN